MKPLLQLRKQRILYYEGGEPQWSTPEVLAESDDYKFLKTIQEQFEQKADDAGQKESTNFWITPLPPAKAVKAVKPVKKGVKK